MPLLTPPPALCVPHHAPCRATHQRPHHPPEQPSMQHPLPPLIPHSRCDTASLVAHPPSCSDVPVVTEARLQRRSLLAAGTHLSKTILGVGEPACPACLLQLLAWLAGRPLPEGRHPLPLPPSSLPTCSSLLSSSPCCSLCCPFHPSPCANAPPAILALPRVFSLLGLGTGAACRCCGEAAGRTEAARREEKRNTRTNLLIANWSPAPAAFCAPSHSHAPAATIWLVFVAGLTYLSISFLAKATARSGLPTFRHVEWRGTRGGREGEGLPANEARTRGRRVV